MNKIHQSQLYLNGEEHKDRKTDTSKRENLKRSHVQTQNGFLAMKRK